jgi:membrane-bound ClpP family serine protease
MNMRKKIEKLNDNPKFPLGPENYKLMAIGFGIIVIGFILLAGGGSDDPEVFNPAIFNFRRVTLAPMVLLFGFGFQIYAIMKRSKSDN